MNTNGQLRLALACWALLLAAGPGMAADAPQHPSALKYEPITYDPPRPADHRAVLSNGMIVFFKEDHSLPTLEVSALIRTGSLYDPPDKAGLASLTGTVMRSGGTQNVPADDLDERLAFLGATISTSIGRTSGDADLFVLAKDAVEGLKLFADVLMRPAFAEKKLELARNQALAAVRNRNDNPRGVLGREFDQLLYGDHPLVREDTMESVTGLTRQDLVDFHQQYFAPNNVILAAAGDFTKEEMLKLLEQAFAGWAAREINHPEVPAVVPTNRPGVFMIQKEINQGYINVGHFGVQDTHPDRFAIDVMNFILGGGSFTSRITTKVRSDEGLAYNTGSRFDYQHDFPGTFYGYVQTKSSTVRYAIGLIADEFRRIREEPVSDREMETAKSFYLDSFPDRFSSARASMQSLARLEYDGFPADYYDTFRDKFNAVTKEDVLRVAMQYIKPDELSVVIVGDIEACKAGSEKYPGKLDDFGPITVIELENASGDDKVTQ